VVHGLLIARNGFLNKQRWNINRPTGVEHATTVTEITETRMPLNYADKFLSSREARWTKDLTHEDVQVRRAAVGGLLRMAEDKGLEDIQFESNKVNCLLEPDKYNMFGALTYQALLSAFHDADWKVRWDAALVFKAAWKTDKMGVDPYMAQLNNMIREHNDTTDPVEPHIDLVEAAGRCSHAYSPYCATLVRHDKPTGFAHPDWRVRYSAVIAMQQMGRLVTESYRGSLLQITRDENAEVRKAAETYWTPKDGGHFNKWVDTTPTWKKRVRYKKRKYLGKS
jgi:hypothetical protein